MTAMAINNAKHIVNEIEGTRCTIVETGVSLERAAFLRDLLEYNNLEVMEMMEAPAEEGGEPLYTIGVTDLMFNPVFAIYERQLKTREGVAVTPGYWKQECIECDPRYWIRRRSSARKVKA
jgi:hypothetical protein